MKAREKNVLLTVLDQRWESYQAQFQNCRREFSEEAVHDLRIAARRFLAVLDMIRTLDPQPRVQKTRRFFKGQLDDLDDLRDVQVMLVELAEAAPRMPALERFQPTLAKREKRFLRIARADIKQVRLSEVQKRIEKIRASLKKPAGGSAPTPPLFQAVDRAYARLGRAYGQIDEQKPATIHRARIAFKKFRYMVEIVAPLLPEAPQDYFKYMHDYQSKMGDIRDVTVLLDTLAELASEGAVDLDLKPIRRHYARRLEALISAFLEDKGDVQTFWRAAPEQDFPWETSHDPLYHPARSGRSSGQRRGRRRQSAAADTQGTAEDAPDRARPKGAGGADRPDPDQPLSSGNADGPDPRQDPRPEER
jgi:CHAD domain-containing protein